MYSPDFKLCMLCLRSNHEVVRGSWLNYYYGIQLDTQVSARSEGGGSECRRTDSRQVVKETPQGSLDRRWESGRRGGPTRDRRVLLPVFTLTSLPSQEVYPCEVGVNMDGPATPVGHK